MNTPAHRKCRRDPHRNGQRSLGAAEGVLVALRGYSLDEAFAEIVDTAKRQNVAPIELAEALVALAANNGNSDTAPEAMAAAKRAWAGLFGVHVDGTRRAKHLRVQLIEAIPNTNETDLLEQQLAVVEDDDRGQDEKSTYEFD